MAAAAASAPAATPTEAVAADSSPRPPMTFRENKSAMMVIVQVPAIDKDGVTATWKPDKAVIYFPSIDGTQHTLALRPFGRVLPDKCRFDVASNNMMVVLWKEEQGAMWGQLERDEPLPPAKAQEQPKVKGFEAAATFDGARKGRVFKLGEHGLGYYDDVGGSAQLGTAAAALSSGSSTLPGAGLSKEQAAQEMLVKMAQAGKGGGLAGSIPGSVEAPSQAKAAIPAAAPTIDAERIGFQNSAMFELD